MISQSIGNMMDKMQIFHISGVENYYSIKKVLFLIGI